MAESRCDLNPAAGAKRFRQRQVDPITRAAAGFVDRYWMVDWDLPADQPYVHESVPDPAIHLVLQQGASRLVGVTTGRFTYPLTGAGRIFGVRFRPAAFHAFARREAAAFTDATVPIGEALGAAGERLESDVMATDPADEVAAISVVERFIDNCRPPADELRDQVSTIVETIAAERHIRTLDQLVERFATSSRTLQRLFGTYVGVAPTWVIRRYRLLEAADRLIDGAVGSWSELAVELGYYDQAHFINDFTAVVGRPPGSHARQIGLVS